ncbi:MAG: dTDP-4-dehydrorhamnose reductase [Coriobacteriia bacterium]|nr:dTDP-4-dehydrorhamnose reductase [Coriobacteriia bacterium]
MPEEAPGRVLVAGAGGSLGRAVTRLLGGRAVPLTHAELEVGDTLAVALAFAEARPSLVVNCVAATDVDRCETDAAYREAGNVVGPANLARAAAEAGCGLVHVSTDFVFDGEKGAAYTEEDEPRPLNAYGESKLAGEREVLASGAEVLVVRSSWVYGDGRSGFPAKVLAWSEESDRLRVAADRWGSPTFAEDLATGLLGLWEAGGRGLFHLAGEGCASRFDLATATLGAAGRGTEAEPAGAGEFPLRAARPRATCLDCSRAAAHGVRLPEWRDGLMRWAAKRDALR